MISRILRRVKMLLGLTDNKLDEFLIYMIEDSINQIELYIHAPINDRLIPVVAKLTVNKYLTGGYEASSVDSEGHVMPAHTPTGVGEVKSESYENVRFEYVTSVDMMEAATGSSSSSSTASAGLSDDAYFQEQIVPLLKGFRKVQVI